MSAPAYHDVSHLVTTSTPPQEWEEAAYQLLASLPRSRLAILQRRIAPLLQFDLVGSLPTEVGLQIFAYLPYQTLLTCTLVCRRWQALANDQSLWKDLCQERGWRWRNVPKSLALENLTAPPQRGQEIDDMDDEGMGDSDEDVDDDEDFDVAQESMSMDMMSGMAGDSLLYPTEQASFLGPASPSSTAPIAGPGPSTVAMSIHRSRSRRDTTKLASAADQTAADSNPRWVRHSAPAILRSTSSSSSSSSASSPPKPDYKLLYLTYVKLRHRYLNANYRRSALQIRGTPRNGHISSIYCLQLYTYPETGKRVIFTGSRDHTVREWNLTTGVIERIISGVHNSSVLSLCARDGYLASAGGDRKVAVWHLASNTLVKVLSDHQDSVLCVRFDKQRLVSCSKDRTVRVYSFPALEEQFVIPAHRSAVNAVSISDAYIVSASGDRSVRLWDAETGKLVQNYESHHSKGIASIDFSWPALLSGSSDRHLRLFDMVTLQGWSTSPEYDITAAVAPALPLPPHPHPHNDQQYQEAASGSSASLLSTSSSNSGSSPSSSSTHYVCHSCGSSHVKPVLAPRAAHNREGMRCCHTGLVRTVSLGDDFVITGSYDKTIKVWDRKTGALVADLAGGHTARIFCLDFDATKIVSCGEDQRICVWDFSHGIDTSFLDLS